MKFVPAGLTRAIGTKVLAAKSNSPHIFFVGGVLGLVGSGVLACRATLKLEDTLDEIKKDLETVKAVGAAANSGVMTDQQHTKAISVVGAKSGMAMIKLYGPAVGLAALSVAALTGSHIQLTRRNTALTAALAAMSKAYDEYRNRVRDEFGKEKELDIYHGIHDEEVVIDGKKQIVKAVDPAAHSPYARLFDEYCMNWAKDAEMNMAFLTVLQRTFNAKLNSNGWVMLNEVYEQLGFEKTRAGAIMGWMRDGDGAGYIDFGMYIPDNSAFVNGRERSVWLDFNVDPGPIINKLGDGE